MLDRRAALEQQLDGAERCMPDGEGRGCHVQVMELIDLASRVGIGSMIQEPPGQDLVVRNVSISRLLPWQRERARW